MKVLLYLPPNLPEIVQKGNWVAREFKHSGMAYRAGSNPFSIFIMAGALRNCFPEWEFTIRDGRLYEETPNELFDLIEQEKFSVVIIFLGAFSLHHDLSYLPSVKGLIRIGCPVPVTIPVDELCRIYEPHVEALTTTSPIDSIIYFLKLISEGKKLNEALSNAPGIFHQQNGQWEGNSPIQNPFPWQSMPPRAFDLVDMKQYRQIMKENGVKLPFAIYQGQVGCPNSCAFCTQSKASLQYLSAEQVVDDLEYLHRVAGYEHISFIDNEFAIDIERAKKICRLIIERELNICWSCQNYVEFVDEELYQLMAEAGCYEVRYGIETADPKVKSLVNKEYSEKSLIKAFELGRKNGIASCAYLIFGLPGETYDGYRHTYELLKRAGCTRFSAGIFFPAPGSKLYWEIKKDGRLLEEDWSLYKNEGANIFKYADGRNREDVKVARAWFQKKLQSHINWKQFRNQKTISSVIVALFDEIMFLAPVNKLKRFIVDHQLYYRPLVALNIRLNNLRRKISLS